MLNPPPLASRVSSAPSQRARTRTHARTHARAGSFARPERRVRQLLSAEAHARARSAVAKPHFLRARPGPRVRRSERHAHLRAPLAAARARIESRGTRGATAMTRWRVRDDTCGGRPCTHVSVCPSAPDSSHRCVSTLSVDRLDSRRIFPCARIEHAS